MRVIINPVSLQKIFLVMKVVIFFVSIIMASSFLMPAHRQGKGNYIRVARIVIDSAKIDAYKAALKEGVETAVRTEPGVITLYAVYAKDNPTHITVFEVYKDMEAYRQHIQTAHFKKYKATVQDMVTSLELVDVEPIAMESKQKL